MSLQFTWFTHCYEIILNTDILEIIIKLWTEDSQTWTGLGIYRIINSNFPIYMYAHTHCIQYIIYSYGHSNIQLVAYHIICIYMYMYIYTVYIFDISNNSQVDLASFCLHIHIFHSLLSRIFIHLFLSRPLVLYKNQQITKISQIMKSSNLHGTELGAYIVCMYII